MWDSKESVYNIITKPALKKARTPPKAPDKALDPITVKTLLWRMKNNMKLRETATFGLLPGSTKPQPSKFLRKHSKEPNLTVKRTTSSSLPVFPPLGAQTLILSAKFNLTMPFYQRFLFFILIVHHCFLDAFSMNCKSYVYCLKSGETFPTNYCRHHCNG